MTSRSFWMVLSVASVALLATACSAETGGEPNTPSAVVVDKPEQKDVVAPASDEMLDFELAADGPQGGCSMTLIRRCQDLCGGPKSVDSCYGNGIGWSTCNCNSGDAYWMQ